MKNLITEKSIKDIIAQGGKTVVIDDDTLITPSARDMIRYNGLELTQGNVACEAAPYANSGAPAVSNCGCADGLSSDMIYNALKKMTDQGMLNGFFDNAAPAAGAAPAGNDAPCQAEHANGFKLVRGGGIKMEVLELENPEDNGKVQYQELIGADVGSAMNAGFMTVDHCTFNWDVEPQEIYYVVEGNMTVTVDGVPHTATPGDCLFIQKGSKVVFSSGNTRAKVFYVTY